MRLIMFIYNGRFHGRVLELEAVKGFESTFSIEREWKNVAFGIF